MSIVTKIKKLTEGIKIKRSIIEVMDKLLKISMTFVTKSEALKELQFVKKTQVTTFHDW